MMKEVFSHPFLTVKIDEKEEYTTVIVHYRTLGETLPSKDYILSFLSTQHLVITVTQPANPGHNHIVSDTLLQTVIPDLGKLIQSHYENYLLPYIMGKLESFSPPPFVVPSVRSYPITYPYTHPKLFEKPNTVYLVMYADPFGMVRSSSDASLPIEGKMDTGILISWSRQTENINTLIKDTNTVNQFVQGVIADFENKLTHFITHDPPISTFIERVKSDLKGKIDDWVGGELKIYLSVEPAERRHEVFRVNTEEEKTFSLRATTITFDLPTPLVQKLIVEGAQKTGGRVGEMALRVLNAIIFGKAEVGGSEDYYDELLRLAEVDSR